MLSMSKGNISEGQSRSMGCQFVTSDSKDLNLELTKGMLLNLSVSA